MKYIKDTIRIIKYNFKTLLKFEILYRILLSLVLIPIAIGSFNLTMKVTGYKYLTLENIFDFFKNPVTICLLLPILVFLTVITLFEISTMIIIFDASYSMQKIQMKKAIKLSLNSCKKVLKLKNILVVFMLLFLIPLLNFGMSSNVISSIKIPEFILDYIRENRVLSLITIILYVILSVMLMRWIYSIHYMILENFSFKRAKNSSKNLSKGNFIKDIIWIAITQLIVSAVYVVYIAIGIAIVHLLNRFLASIKVLESILVTIIWLFIVISLIIFALIANAISYGVISSFYYEHKKQKKEEIIKYNYEEKIDKKKENKFKKRVIVFSIGVTLVFGSIFSYQVITGKANLNIEFVREMEITAHRGASIDYPENTMSAFKAAKDLGADWIELDVQQTKDNQIVVSHDHNLSRIAGINKNISDMNYDEISKLDVGSFLDKKFKDERIPLLEDVIKFAKEKSIRLNIELKPTGKEKNFEKNVIDLIQKHSFKEMCVITSQNYNVLKNIKKYDKDIQTIYVMSIAIGKITELEYADGFSVEATNVTKKLVKRVHNKGKELYAWTVNTDEGINKMINLNVDNIITDDIVLGKKLVIESKQSDLVTEFLKLLKNE